MPAKVLICDLGNVIMFFDRRRAYRALSRRLGIPDTKIEEAIEKTDIRQRHEKRKLTDEQFYNEIMSLFNASRKVPYEVFRELWGNIFRPNRDMVEALKLLAGEVKLILLSNTSHLHFAHIEKHYGRIIALFDGRLILSYKEEVAKPDRRIFEKAAYMAGTDCGDCIYVDDKVEYVRVANKLGMKGIVFHSYAQFVGSLKEWGLDIEKRLIPPE